jgi:hypothetical protein
MNIQSASVMDLSTPQNMLREQLRLDEMYIQAMWGTIQGVLPMISDKTIDKDYREVIVDRIKTWHKLMMDAQEHHAKLKDELQQYKNL